MSTLTAKSVYPIVEGLSASEKAKLFKLLKETLTDNMQDNETRKAPKGYENLHELFWPSNKEQLITDLANSKINKDTPGQ